MHVKDFKEQKKAFLSNADSTLATPYLPNLVEFVCVCVLLLLRANLGKDKILVTLSKHRPFAMFADHSVWA